MTTKRPSAPKNLPVPPQPSALAIRETAQRILGNLVECLVDHIVLFHQSEHAADAACEFAITSIRNNVKQRAQAFRRAGLIKEDN